MRTGLLAAAVAVLLAPSLTVAADPPIVYQTQPLGRLMDDLRATLALVGGDQAVESFNRDVKRTLGDKGFDGFDLNRPVVGYVDIPADPANTVAVLVLPVTGEKEFVTFCERWNGGKPKALKDGLYELPAANPGLKAVMRITDGYAHVATGANDPARVLADAALVPVNKLYDPTDASLLAGRVYFDRLPKELRGQAKAGLEMLQKAMAGGPNPGGGGPAMRGFVFGLGAQEGKILGEPVLKMATRYVDLSEGAKDAALRVNLDPATGEATADFTVTPVPGSPLAKLLAESKPTTNRFAGLLGPDTVAGGQFKLPLFADELKAGFVDGFEALRKELANNNFVGPAKPFLDELLKGLSRTAKAGRMDVAACLRGPAKDGTFTAVGAVEFDDPSAVEKELKGLIQGQAPQDLQDALKWDAEKAGGVGIHTLDLSKLPNGDRELLRLFGERAVLAFAFAPTAAYVAVGPDAVAVVKGAMALKPAASPGLGLAVNPDRLVKAAATMDARGGAEVARRLGKENKLTTALSLSAEGGKELRVKLAINARLVGVTWFGRASGATFEPVPPPVAK